MDYSANKHRIVCGWNEELNCYVYRGDVKNYPPLAGDEGRGDNPIEPTELRHDTYPPVEEPIYKISNESQGTADPRPRSCSQDDFPWEDLRLVNQAHLNSRSSIGRFDDVIITTVSDEDGEPHNEPGRVLECRVHPSGKQYLLVAWWYNRSMLAKARPKYERYLNEKWPLKGPLKAPFEFILGCQFDVIDSDTVLRKVLNDGTFCTTMVYGGVYHKHEIFSLAPDTDEHLKLIGIVGGSRKRETDLVRQQNLHSLLFGGV